MESLIVIFGVLFVITLIVLYFWSIIWSFRDASIRGKNGFAVATLVALFAWPFGLLFWTIIRPENIKIREKPFVTNKVTEPYKYMTDFKEMPFLLKILLLISIYSFITTLLNFIQMKPVTFEFFNSGFPKNFPAIWYLYYLLFDIAAIVVYFKRSYSVLKKYIYASLGVLVIGVLNSIYSVINLPTEQKFAATLLYVFIYIFFGLIFVYQLKQRKYFNQA